LLPELVEPIVYAFLFNSLNDLPYVAIPNISFSDGVPLSIHVFTAQSYEIEQPIDKLLPHDSTENSRQFTSDDHSTTSG
jgi:hypothetical protein